MDIKNIYKKITTPINKDVDLKWHFAPLVSISLWVLFSIVSIFTTPSDVLSDPFVIFSIIARLTLPIPSVFFIKKYYYEKKLSILSYKHYLNFFGYSITLTYVLYMLPTVVKDFYNFGDSTLLPVVFTMICTLFPVLTYLALRNVRGKSNSGFFTKKEVELEIKIKKDKKAKRKNQKSLRKQRSKLQNLWFELFDPFFWAIIWVLILHNFLFQLYQIPSSSMVPQFMEQDRVVVSKLLKGPGIPLTKYNLPEISKPKVGEIVTFNNPKINDPQSELHYKNVFTRICQPFVFMLTLSKVDIDAYKVRNAAGEIVSRPKERQLVKRVIGVPGEKISIVNDKVYKKVKGGEWTLMSEIEGQEEYGHNSLFSLTNGNSGEQLVNPRLRKEVDKAAFLVASITKEQLEEELVKEKKLFINNLRRVYKKRFYENLEAYLSVKSISSFKILEVLNSEYVKMVYANRPGESIVAKNKLVEDYNKAFDSYNKFIKFKKLVEFSKIKDVSADNISKEIYTEIEIDSASSPYDIFVKKLNGLVLLRTLQLYNNALTTGKFSFNSDTRPIVDDLTVLSLYINGIYFIEQDKTYSENFLDELYRYNVNYNRVYTSFFAAGNLPEYPSGEGNYIPEGEYFLLGDNRYNSLDSRLGGEVRKVYLDDNNKRFTQFVYVGWDPHTYSDKYILGRARFIVWPLNRFKILF